MQQPLSMSPVEAGDVLRLIDAPGGYELCSDRGLHGWFCWLPDTYPDAAAASRDGDWEFRRPGRRGWRIVGFPAGSSSGGAGGSRNRALRYRRRLLQPGGAIELARASCRLTKRPLRANRWELFDNEYRVLAQIKSHPLAWKGRLRRSAALAEHRLDVATRTTPQLPDQLDLLLVFACYVVVLEDTVAAGGLVLGT